MKITEQTRFVVELDNAEAGILCTVINTVQWSSLPAEARELATAVCTMLYPDKYWPAPYPGAQINLGSDDVTPPAGIAERSYGEVGKVPYDGRDTALWDLSEQPPAL